MDANLRAMPKAADGKLLSGILQRHDAAGQVFAIKLLTLNSDQKVANAIAPPELFGTDSQKFATLMMRGKRLCFVLAEQNVCACRFKCS